MYVTVCNKIFYELNRNNCSSIHIFSHITRNHTNASNTSNTYKCLEYHIQYHPSAPIKISYIHIYS